MTEISSKVERKVARVDENQTVLDAAAVMVDRYIGSVVVTRASEVRGIFTERDLIRVVSQQKDPAKTQLASVMRTDLVRVSPDASIEQSLELMRSNRCRHLLVFEQATFAGIVSLRDLVALMLEEKEALIENLRGYINS